MKIIHTADLHMDSRLVQNFTSEASSVLREELMASFMLLVKRARDIGATIFLIAGDMFDTASNALLTIKEQAASVIRGAPEIEFFYLAGNHDNGDYFSHIKDIPNLHQFSSDKWTSYEVEGVTITGREVGKKLSPAFYDELSLDPTSINIVMLHGDASFIAGGDYHIDLDRLKGKGIDYLALGHIHKRSSGALDERGVWCYPGCLTGRGFDEVGVKGFELLTIEGEESKIEGEVEGKIGGKKIVHEAVPFAKRTVHEVTVNLKGFYTYNDAIQAIKDKLQGDSSIKDCDIIRVVLRGGVSEDSMIDAERFSSQLSCDYFCVKVVDKTHIAVDYKKYTGDVSLKGEFIKLIAKDAQLTDEKKGDAIHMLLRALSEEKIEV